MFKVAIAVALSSLLVGAASAQNFPAITQSDGRPPAQANAKDTDHLTEAAVIALIIAGSIAAYKALGRPCACPEDRMRNGRICGGNSAWSRPGGYRPLCYPKDVTASMIAAYRATKAIPPLQ